MGGHNKPITSMGLSKDRRTIYTAASDGTVISWDSESGRNDRVGGKGHGVQVSGLSGGAQLQTIGYDDTVRTIDPVTGEYSGVAVSLSAQPKGIDSKDDMTFVCTGKSIVIMKSGSVLEEINVEYEPSCCAFSATHNHLVVGEGSGNILRVYSTVGGSTDLVQEITLTGSAMDLTFSPDQKYLVSADSNRQGKLRGLGSKLPVRGQWWAGHLHHPVVGGGPRQALYYQKRPPTEPDYQCVLAGQLQLGLHWAGRQHQALEHYLAQVDRDCRNRATYGQNNDGNLFPSFLHQFST